MSVDRDIIDDMAYWVEENEPMDPVRFIDRIGRYSSDGLPESKEGKELSRALGIDLSWFSDGAPAPEDWRKDYFVLRSDDRNVVVLGGDYRDHMHKENRRRELEW